MRMKQPKNSLPLQFLVLKFDLGQTHCARFRANPDWVPASRPSQFRPVDNLIPPGPVEGKALEAVQTDFERATVVRRSDNLALEGEREFATTASKEYRAISATSAGKAKAVRRRTWTKQG